MPDPLPLHDVLQALVQCLVSVHRLHPVRVRVDIEEDPENALTWRLKEIADGLIWQQRTASSLLPAQVADNPSNVRTEERDKKSGLDETTKAILLVLRKSKRPLTKTMMLEALEEAQRKGEIDDHCSISESTVCRRLKELMEDGTISNPEDAKPRGYRFSE